MQRRLRNSSTRTPSSRQQSIGFFLNNNQLTGAFPDLTGTAPGADSDHQLSSVPGEHLKHETNLNPFELNTARDSKPPTWR
jgi:hypothetical protein